MAGVVVLVSYLLARNAVGAPPASECLVKTESNDSVANVICWQPSSAATVALLVTAFWILVVLSRPFRLWKAALVLGGGGTGNGIEAHPFEVVEAVLADQRERG